MNKKEDHREEYKIWGQADMKEKGWFQGGYNGITVSGGGFVGRSVLSIKACISITEIRKD